MGQADMPLGRRTTDNTLDGAYDENYPATKKRPCTTVTSGEYNKNHHALADKVGGNTVGKFQLPPDIIFNTEKLSDPLAFAQANQAVSWLYLNGSEFAAMDGGMSYDQVQKAVDRSINIISDPPRDLNLDLARQHVAALDELPRPTLVTCRAGPRASAVAYMYAGLRAGADPAEVIAQAEREAAPFCQFDDYKVWVSQSMEALKREQ